MRGVIRAKLSGPKPPPRPPVPGALFGGFVPQTTLADLVKMLGKYYENRLSLAWNWGVRSRTLTAAEVARATGISPQRLNNLLVRHCGNPIRQHEFDKILAALGIHILDLIDQRGLPGASAIEPSNFRRRHRRARLLEMRLERVQEDLDELQQAVSGQVRGDMPSYRLRLRAGISSIVEELEAMAVEQVINRAGKLKMLPASETERELYT